MELKFVGYKASFICRVTYEGKLIDHAVCVLSSIGQMVLYFSHFDTPVLYHRASMSLGDGAVA